MNKSVLSMVVGSACTNFWWLANTLNSWKDGGWYIPAVLSSVLVVVFVGLETVNRWDDK